MKNILLKTICLASSVSVLPLVACAQKQTNDEFKNEINSAFYNQLLNVCMQKQIKNEKLWEKFVDVFRTHEDTDVRVGQGRNWRCEFWGKMMRGAVWCYRYTHDEKLYEILTESVKDILTTQDEFGRISTYEVKKEFHSWDLWGRKYVMTALLHYYEICKDEGLKNQIIEALKKHANYIVAKIGDGPGQIDITTTGYDEWLGINSCTILEPMANLYEVTHEKRYLDFCAYIIRTGGVHGDRNMITEVLSGVKPSDLPCVKAYESMSFFEGVYRYGKIIHDQNLITAALTYFADVYENEITVVGTGGYMEERWDHGVEKQTTSHTGQEHPHRFGQETCVTVTWMRILNILYEETHDIKYYERFAQSAMNAFLTTLNIYNQKVASELRPEEPIEGFPFDTYSPLCDEPHGFCDGGTCLFFDSPEIELYGCCQCNAPIVVGMMGINYCREFDNKLYLNEYYSGAVHRKDSYINISGDYLSKGTTTIEIDSSSNEQLMLRIPSWANNPEVKINDNAVTVTAGSYFNAGALKDIETITIDFKPQVVKQIMNNKAYFTYGPYVLAMDTFINQEFSGQLQTISMADIQPEVFTPVGTDKDDPGEFVRFSIPFGGKTIYLNNYSAAGRKCYKLNAVAKGDENLSHITVFFKNE